VVMSFPAGNAVNLVNRNDEGGFACFEDFYAFKRLRFEPTHSVYDENGDVSHTSASTPQIRECLMPRGIHDKQPGNFYACFEAAQVWSDELFEGFDWEEAGSDVLCHAACFAELNVGFSEFIKQRGFA